MKDKMLSSQKRETELFYLSNYNVEYNYFTDQYDNTIYNTAKQRLKQNLIRTKKAFKKYALQTATMTIPLFERDLLDNNTNRFWKHRLSDYVLHGGIHISLTSLSSVSRIKLVSSNIKSLIFKYQFIHPLSGASLPFFVTSSNKILNTEEKQECTTLLKEMYRMLNISHIYTLKTRTILHSCHCLIGRILCGASCSPVHCGGTCSVSFFPEDVQTTAFEHFFDEEDTTISWEWSMMIPGETWLSRVQNELSYNRVYNRISELLPNSLKAILSISNIKQQITFGVWTNITFLNAIQKTIPKISGNHNHYDAYRISSKQGLRKKDLCHVIRKKQTLPHPFLFLFDQFSNGWKPLHLNTPVLYSFFNNFSDSFSELNTLWPWTRGIKNTNATQPIAWIAFESDYEIRYMDDGTERTVANLIQCYVSSKSHLTKEIQEPYIPEADRIATVLFLDISNLTHIDMFLNDIEFAIQQNMSINLLNKSCLSSFFYKEKTKTEIEKKHRESYVCYHLHRIWERFVHTIQMHAHPSIVQLNTNELDKLSVCKILGHVYVSNLFQFKDDTTICATCEPCVMTSYENFNTFFYKDIPYTLHTINSGISPLYNFMKYQLTSILKAYYTHRTVKKQKEHMDIYHSDCLSHKSLLRNYKITQFFGSLSNYTHYYKTHQYLKQNTKLLKITDEDVNTIQQLAETAQHEENELKKSVSKKIPIAINHYNEMQRNLEIKQLVKSLKNNEDITYTPTIPPASIQNIATAAFSMPYTYQPYQPSTIQWSPRLSQYRHTPFSDNL